MRERLRMASPYLVRVRVRVKVRVRVRVRGRGRVEDGVAVLVCGVVGDGLEESLDVRVERVVKGRRQSGVKQHDVRHSLRGVTHHKPALQPREGPELGHPNEDVARVQVRVDHIVPDDHLEQRLIRQVSRDARTAIILSSA